MLVVYLDVFFMLNWWMNLLLLMVTGLFCRELPRAWRMVFAAAVGAAGACIALVLPGEGRLLVLVPLLVAVNKIAFPSLNFRRLLARSAVYLAATLALGGLLDWWYFQVLGKSPRMGGLVLLAGVLAVVLVAGNIYLRGRKQTEGYKVLLYVGESHLITQGFLDSGNLLTDALGRPVHILEEACLYTQCPELKQRIQEKTGGMEQFDLGYNSLGGDGTLHVIICDRLVVPALGVDRKRPLVGLSERTLFKEGGCHMLLHGSLKEPCT
jgi:sigma-E processing peptidase SpoIIGA